MKEYESNIEKGRDGMRYLYSMKLGETFSIEENEEIGMTISRTGSKLKLDIMSDDRLYIIFNNHNNSIERIYMNPNSGREKYIIYDFGPLGINIHYTGRDIRHHSKISIRSSKLSENNYFIDPSSSVNTVDGLFKLIIDINLEEEDSADILREISKDEFDVITMEKILDN